MRYGLQLLEANIQHVRARPSGRWWFCHTDSSRAVGAIGGVHLEPRVGLLHIVGKGHQVPVDLVDSCWPRPFDWNRTEVEAEGTFKLWVQIIQKTAALVSWSTRATHQKKNTVRYLSTHWKMIASWSSWSKGWAGLVGWWGVKLSKVAVIVISRQLTQVRRRANNAIN